MGPVERLEWLRFVVLNSNLGAIKVAAVIERHWNAEAGYAWPSFDTLVKSTGCSRQGVANAIAELEKNGFIAVERSKGAGNQNRYRPVWSCIKNKHDNSQMLIRNNGQILIDNSQKQIEKWSNPDCDNGQILIKKRSNGLDCNLSKNLENNSIKNSERIIHGTNQENGQEQDIFTDAQENNKTACVAKINAKDLTAQIRGMVKFYSLEAAYSNVEAWMLLATPLDIIEVIKARFLAISDKISVDDVPALLKEYKAHRIAQERQESPEVTEALNLVAHMGPSAVKELLGLTCSDEMVPDVIRENSGARKELLGLGAA